MTSTPRLLEAEKKICVSIMADSTAAAISLARQNQEVADVLEIRLDRLADPSIAPFTEALRKPLLFTNRAKWEGGHFPGDEKARVSLLIEAAQHGAAYVDIELRTEERLRRELIEAAPPQTGVIVSWHDFSTTPGATELSEIVSRMHGSGAAIGKLVTTPHCFQDVLRVLNLQAEAATLGLPLIAFCMGEIGMISRVATLNLGGFMTYAAPTGGQATAPGQLPAATLRDIFRSLTHAD